MKKIVHIGIIRPQHARRGYSLFCSISFESGKLSITGVEGPLPSGNARGSCGQIVMSDWPVTAYAPGWSAGLVRKFRATWERWHLNDMKAGTPAQDAVLARRKAEYKGYPQSHYDWALQVLAEEGLASDNGYRYGSKWLKEEVPQDVIDFLFSLPDADQKPAWI